MSRNNLIRHTSAGNGRARAKNILHSHAKLRAREPINRSFGMIRGKFPSQKMGRMIHWESQLERDAVLLFEFSNGVIAYREQPLTTYYTLNGKTRRYTPDFELTLSTGEVVLIEIKPAAKLLDLDESLRFKRIQEHFTGNGRPFRILTDREIRRPALLENLRLLMRNRRGSISPFERRRFVERFAGISAVPFANALALLEDAGVVWSLIAEGVLTCDLTKEVNEQTILRVVAKENKNEKLFF